MQSFFLLIYTLGCLLLTAASQAAPACDPLDTQIELTPVSPQTSHGIRRHLQLAAAPRMPVDLVLFGDSLVESWPDKNAATIAPRFVNLGIGADKAYSAIWRLTNADWTGYAPQMVILLLGTNDLNFVVHPCAIAIGLERVIELMQKMWPAAHIYDIDILPRGPGFQKFEAGRKAIAALLRSHFIRSARVSFINVDADISCDGKIPCSNYKPDLLHLTDKGYDVLTTRVRTALHPSTER